MRIVSIIAALILVTVGTLIGLSLLLVGGDGRMAGAMLTAAIAGVIILIDLCIIEPRNRSGGAE